MSILDFFKKKKKIEEPKKEEKKEEAKKIEKKPVKKEAKKPAPKKTRREKPLVKKEKPPEPKEQKFEISREKPLEIPPQKAKKGDVKIAPKVLYSPHITEKATFLQEKNQYIFKVFSSANKQEIKKGIEEIYGVRVEKVRIVNIHRKARRLGRISGWKKGYKKAIVTLKKGESIEMMPM